MYRLILAHLYPEQMNVYGDRGNVIALQQRCRRRGIELTTLAVHPGSTIDWQQVDLAFFGGGQDSGQALITDDLITRQGPALRAAIEQDLVMLAICGGYQLLGHYFQTHDGTRLPGLGVLDVTTIAGKKRLIGNILVESDFGRGPIQLVGFENHSGRTVHGPGVRPLGRVRRGAGDNGRDGRGGAIYRNTYGCYLHGSLLPKNPQLTDHLIDLALRRRYGEQAVAAPAAAEFELRAQSTMVQRLLGKG